MKRMFRGKCKNCPHGERSKVNKDTILCEFGGIREEDQKCNILVPTTMDLKEIDKLVDMKIKEEL